MWLFSLVFAEVCLNAADAQSTSERSESRSLLLFPQGQFVLQTIEQQKTHTHTHRHRGIGTHTRKSTKPQTELFRKRKLNEGKLSFSLSLFYTRLRRYSGRLAFGTRGKGGDLYFWQRPRPAILFLVEVDIVINDTFKLHVRVVIFSPPVCVKQCDDDLSNSSQVIPTRQPFTPVISRWLFFCFELFFLLWIVLPR